MNFLLRFLYLLLKFAHIIIYPLRWIKSREKKKTIPKITDPVLTISATNLAEKIRNREVKCEYVCMAYIRRIKEVNPIINAVVEDRFESALQEARNIDNYLQTSSDSNEDLKRTKPLLGVPLTVKESCSLAGLSLCGGTLQRAGIKADKDSEVVAKLKESGAIPLLVSNTPEICLGWDTFNFVTGRTLNPYDTRCSAAGSSGGEGALLGCGASLIGVGSDVAGSVRLPAMFNCVFGHKPTARIIPIKGHYPYCSDERYPDFLVIGPMTRYGQDLKLMAKIMTSNDILPTLNLDQKVELSQVKVFFMEAEGKSVVLPQVQNEIVSAIKQSVEYLKTKSNCQIVDDVKFADLKNSCEIGGSTLYTLKNIPNLLKSDNHNFVIEILKSLVGLSNYTFNLLLFYIFEWLYKNFISNEGYIRKNEYLRQLFTETLGENGVFLYPTFPNSAFKSGSFLFHCIGTSYLMIFNTLGLPSTHVPCGFDKNGLPIGIQIVAAPYQDRLCFAVAEELEKCFGGWIPPN